MSAAAFARLSRYSKSPEAAARIGEGVPVTMCRGCVFNGKHAKAAECINLLRSHTARLQFAKKGSGPRKQTTEK